MFCSFVTFLRSRFFFSGPGIIQKLDCFSDMTVLKLLNNQLLTLERNFSKNISFCLLDCFDFQGRHWTSPAMAAILQAATNAPPSDRLKEVFRIAPHLLDVYFAIALHDVNDCMFMLDFEVY